MLPMILKKFNLIIAGRGFAGLVDEIQLPKLSIKTEEYRAGGMDAPAMIDMGMEKLEASFTMSQHDPQVFSQFGLFSGSAVRLQFRAAAANDQAVLPYVVKCTGMYTELDPGTLKSGDKTPLKATLALRHYELSIAGVELIYIDVDNMIRRINGVDQLLAMRAAIYG